MLFTFHHAVRIKSNVEEWFCTKTQNLEKSVPCVLS
uniref:Uncharacterized protein n=1 Tax=Anguilla anguilla TaxID=7936 RepID=A0A0E9QFJ1_ANGAN